MNIPDHMLIRRNRKQYPLHKRNLGVWIAEIRERNKLIITIPEIIDEVISLEDLIDDIIDDNDDDDDNNNDIDDMQGLLDILYDLLQASADRFQFLAKVNDVGVDPISIPPITLDNISDQECTEKFRFTKAKLDKLIGNIDPLLDRYDGLLKIPTLFRFDNRSKVDGKIAILYYINRNVKWDRLNDSEKVLGREYSTNSRIYRAVTDWLYDEWSWRVKDNRQFEEFWVPRFPEANRKFIARYSNMYGSPPPARYTRTAGVYDA
jgi:hypothetical protein